MFKLFVAILIGFAAHFSWINCASADAKFVYYQSKKPNVLQRWYNKIINRPTAQNIVVIAGVSKYTGSSLNLESVGHDIKNLKALFSNQLKYNTIIEITDDKFTKDNLKHVLRNIVTPILKRNQGSRLIFIFTGHGYMPRGDRNSTGYIPTADALTINDFPNSIKMTDFRKMLMDAAQHAHQSLTILNACHSGAFAQALGRANELFGVSGHRVIMTSMEDQRTYSHPTKKGTAGIETFLEIFKGENKRARAILSKGMVTTFDIYSYLHIELARLFGSQSNPKLAHLFKTAERGGLVLALDKSKIRNFDASKVSKPLKSLRPLGKGLGFEFVNDVMVEPGLIDYAPSHNSSERKKGTTIKHLVLGYSFGRTAQYFTRRSYIVGVPPGKLGDRGSVHAVVYRDGAVDQFVPFNKKAHAIGAGNRKGINNDTTISLWFDSAGILGRCSNDECVSLKGDVLKVSDVFRGKFSRFSTSLLQDPSCRHKPVKNVPAWERVRPAQLKTMEYLISKLVTEYGLSDGADAVVALHEIRCDKFAPGPQLNPWLKCIKSRLGSGRAVRGCWRAE